MTAQIRERLILEGGEVVPMTFCPPLPWGHPDLTDAASGEGAAKDDGVYYSTACWRRYRATWALRERRLYLARVQGQYRLRSNRPIHADWFTGVLRAPIGEPLVSVHMGFGDVYAWELHIKVVQGVVVATRLFDADQESTIDELRAALRNLPGMENYFDGEDW